MPTRLTQIVVDIVDTAELAPIARFWSALLGWPITLEDPDEYEVEGPHMGIVFGPVPEPKTVKNRVHLDLASSSEAHQRELVDKALELGARRIDIGQGDTRFVVLADPQGNELCVLEPRPEHADTGAFAAIVQDCVDPAAVAPLWSAATGRPVAQQTDTVAMIRLSEGGPWLALVRAPDVKKIKNRVHIDIAPYAGDDQAAEVDRLVALGAQHVDVGQGDDVTWVCLADQEGSEVCVLSPRD